MGKKKPQASEAAPATAASAKAEKVEEPAEPAEEPAASKEKEHEKEKKDHEKEKGGNEAKEDDLPIVKDLKALDDKYLEIEKEYDRELVLIQQKYNDKQAPLLEERQKVLMGNSEDKPQTGTPALEGFWAQAMKNHSALEDLIEEWDEPVLEFLSNITKCWHDVMDHQKGFQLSFHFVENPYFTNDVLTKDYYTEETSPYTGEMDVNRIDVSEIEWKAGKNVTVEKVKKPVKGGGAKKAKQKAKEKDEPRSSFFRNFFRKLDQDGELPDDINLEEMGIDPEMDEDDEVLTMIMEQDYEVGSAIRDQLIPWAVRWYTGEAEPQDDDDDDEGDEEEEDISEDDEDDEDEDDEDEPPAPKKKAQAKKKGGGGGGSDSKKPAAAGAAGENKEECKQQ